jgi:hypothetical protein
MQSSQILLIRCSYFCDSKSQQTFTTHIVSCSCLWNLFCNVRRRSAHIVYRFPSSANTTKTLFATGEVYKEPRVACLRVKLRLFTPPRHSCSCCTVTIFKLHTKTNGYLPLETTVIFCMRRKKKYDQRTRHTIRNVFRLRS